jgi:hypothetical protein
MVTERPAAVFLATRSEAGWTVESHLGEAFEPAVPYMAGDASVVREGPEAFLVAHSAPDGLRVAAVGKEAVGPTSILVAVGARCHSPSMVAVPGGLALAWIQGDPKSGERLHLAVAEGRRFGTPVQVPTRERFAFSPRLAAGGGVLVLAWSERDLFGYGAKSRATWRASAGRSSTHRRRSPTGHVRWTPTA